MNERQIIACVDRSDYATAVADCASWVSRQIHAPIEFLQVIDRHLEQGSGEDHSGAIGMDAQENLLNKLLTSESEQSKKAREQGRLFLNALRERVLEQGVAVANSRLRHGTLVDCLIERQDDARVVVLGRRGKSTDAANKPIGRSFEAAVRAVNRPVMGVHAQFKEPSRFLFAFDGSAVSKRGVKTVLESQLFKGLQGTLLMVGVKNPQGDKLLEQAARELTDAGVPTEFHRALGDTVSELVKGLERHQADLLVMGAYTHSPLRKLFFGSTTTDILKATQVPALLLR